MSSPSWASLDEYSMALYTQPSAQQMASELLKSSRFDVCNTRGLRHVHHLRSLLTQTAQDRRKPVVLHLPMMRVCASPPRTQHWGCSGQLRPDPATTSVTSRSSSPNKVASLSGLPPTLSYRSYTASLNQDERCAMRYLPANCALGRQRLQAQGRLPRRAYEDA